MGTKQQTQQTVNYDPTSLGQYQQFWQLATPLLTGMATNPFTSPSYQLNLSQATQAAHQQGSMAMQNALANLNTAGMGQTNSGLRAGLLSQLGRYGSNLGYQGFLSAVNQAQSNQWNALSMLGSRTPLVTGQTGTSKTSGLGTWLPQLAGAAISGLTGGLTGGLGAAVGAGASQLNSMANAGIQQAGLTPTFSQLPQTLSPFLQNTSNRVGTSSGASMSNPLTSYFPPQLSQ